MNTFPASLLIPREAGLLHFGVRSTYIFGTANWLNFVPLNRRSFSESGPAIKIEFFCRLECTEGLVL